MTERSFVSFEEEALMRYGTVISLQNHISDYGRFLDDYSRVGYSVDEQTLPPEVEVDDDVAYVVEIWENDSGLVYYAEED